MKYVILSDRPWNEHLAVELNATGIGEFIPISNPKNFNLDYLGHVQPIKIFVPHWSRIIPAEIFEQFECIIFHMTDLPFGRGGSPLQNLILRGVAETKICAIKCIEILDAGDVYLRNTLKLDGSAEEIFYRASGVIKDMILEIIKSNPQPVRQVGEIVSFTRRKPEDSEIPRNLTPDQLFDFVRMLDAPGYPKAYVDLGTIRIELGNADISSGFVRFNAEVKPVEVMPTT